MNPWLLALALTGAGCLVVQGFRLDERLDAWLRDRIIDSAHKTNASVPGDDGCWLDMVKIAGWLTVFAVYAIVNLFIF